MRSAVVPQTNDDAPGKESSIGKFFREKCEREEESKACRSLENQIRAVPDALFADDPEVQRLQAQISRMEQRCALVSNVTQTQRLKDRIEAMKAEIAQKEAEISFAAVDDLADDPLTFERAFSLSEEVRRMKLLIEIGHKAIEKINSRRNGMHEFHDALQRAKSDLFHYLKGLKRAHLGLDKEGN